MVIFHSFLYFTRGYPMIPMMMKFHEIPINYLDDFHIPGCFFDSQLKDLFFKSPLV